VEIIRFQGLKTRQRRKGNRGMGVCISWEIANYGIHMRVNK